MRRNKFAILLTLALGLLAFIIVLSLVFTVFFIEFDGLTIYGKTEDVARADSFVRGKVEKVRYSSIFLFDKESVEKDVNEILNVEATEVECVFPNKIVIHYTLSTCDYMIAFDGGYALGGQNGKALITGRTDFRESDDSLVLVSFPGSESLSIKEGDKLLEKESLEREVVTQLLYRTPYFVNKNGEQVFNKNSIKDISIFSARDIRFNLWTGLSVKITCALDHLDDAVKEFVSWYSEASDEKKEGGSATVSFSETAGKIRISYGL